MKRKFSKTTKQKFWKRGELSQVARISGIRLSSVSGIFHRALGVSPGRALVLSGAVKAATGKDIPLVDLIFNKTSKNPCFF